MNLLKITLHMLKKVNIIAVVSRKRSENLKPIVIQGAVEYEINLYLSLIKKVKFFNLMEYDFYQGEIDNVPIIICRTGVGLVNAAAATLISIYEFKPTLIISQGIAGAHKSFLNIGDIIVGTQSTNINSYITPPLKNGEGSHPEDWNIYKRVSPCYADSDLVKFYKNRLSAARKQYEGIIGSGDIFNQEFDRIMWLSSRHSTMCEDMETFSVYSVCNRFNVPCIGIRIISNNALLNNVYNKNVAYSLQKELLETLSVIHKGYLE